MKQLLCSNGILTTGMLQRTLGDDDDFVTVTFQDREYVIDHVKRVSNCSDTPDSHKTLVISDGGNGEIKR